jgi:hypothetical protein
LKGLGQIGFRRPWQCAVHEKMAPVEGPFPSVVHVVMMIVVMVVVMHVAGAGNGWRDNCQGKNSCENICK